MVSNNMTAKFFEPITVKTWGSPPSKWPSQNDFLRLRRRSENWVSCFSKFQWRCSVSVLICTTVRWLLSTLNL